MYQFDAILEAFRSGGKGSVIPNGVDLPYRADVPEIHKSLSTREAILKTRFNDAALSLERYTKWLNNWSKSAKPGSVKPLYKTGRYNTILHATPQWRTQYLSIAFEQKSPKECLAETGDIWVWTHVYYKLICEIKSCYNGTALGSGNQRRRELELYGRFHQEITSITHQVKLNKESGEFSSSFNTFVSYWLSVTCMM